MQFIHVWRNGRLEPIIVLRPWENEMPIHWRSETDIQEENRYGSEPSPVRATAIMTVKCLDCGGEITEVHFSDGHRSFVEYGVREVLGEGVRHGRCPK